MKSKIKTCAAVALAAAMATGLAAAPASAGPVASGCPAGFQLLSVDELTTQGYHLPARVDDPASGLMSFGQPGNGDGYVCGRALPQLTSFGGTLYEFTDNTLPAA
jgi:hypothetical protein